VFASLRVLLISDVAVNTAKNKYHTAVSSQQMKAFLPVNRLVTAETSPARTWRLTQLQSAGPSF